MTVEHVAVCWSNDATRVGRVLVVVADIGGEAGDGRREPVAELIGPALRRTSFPL